MAWGFYQAIYVAPNDAMQGEISHIFYLPRTDRNAVFSCFFRRQPSGLDRVPYVAPLAAQAGPKPGTRGRCPPRRWEWFYCTIVLVYRTDLGTEGVGHLVDVGLAPDPQRWCSG